jgi:NAD(P)-dependent dehydrogenase (short-subunit alcohol dehydrogenase family)
VAATHGDELADVRVMVTGAAGDIGAAIVREIARRGALVHALDRRPSQHAEQRAIADGAAAYHEVDIRDRADVERALAATGDLDVVFVNAGIAIAAPFLELAPEHWHEQLGINLTGSFNVAQLAARAMAARGRGGRIAFTGSWIQAIPWPEMTSNSASKAAVRMLARSMALELAPHRILVNVLTPGIVDAGMARRQRLTEPQYAARAARVIPLGEMQTAEQVARAAAFLCSDGADYMTGADLLVDGGCSLFHVED